MKVGVSISYVMRPRSSCGRWWRPHQWKWGEWHPGTSLSGPFERRTRTCKRCGMEAEERLYFTTEAK